MKRRIVIADDDPTIINLVSLRLGLASFDVLSAQSGPDALELIQRSEPLAAILDVRMPGGGLAALDAIKANPRSSKLPVMMLSGERDPGTVMNAMGAGASDYMVKPFNPEQLLERVQRMIRVSGGEAAIPRKASSAVVWEL